ncbi:ead/Ea22-like family protein [Escherichia coli]|nr:ead/Ea22-like family protein [Escherichia coli]
MDNSTELAQRMKAAALKATQGEWRWERDGGFSYLLAEGDTSPENRIIDDGSAWGEYAETISPDSFDAAHIATSCPQNVLALVEALEARDEQRANWFQMAEKLGHELDVAEKRIAELECITGALREIRPGHITIAGEKIGIYMRDEIDAALAAAGVAVEGE